VSIQSRLDPLLPFNFKVPSIAFSSKTAFEMVHLSIPIAEGRRRSGLIEWAVPEQGQSHNATVLADWFHLHLLGLDGSDKAVLDGCSLSIPAVTAVARYVSHSVPK
jgi:hypothetical protein